MDGNLFELLGVPDADPQPTFKPAAPPIQLPTPIQSSHRPYLGLHDFLAQHYPVRAEQQRGFGPIPLQIDDRTPADRSNNFCDISVTVPVAVSDRFALALTNPPWNEEVRALVRGHQGQWFDEVAQTRIVINVRLKRHGLVRELAQAIRSVVSVRHINRTGERYPVRDWRWLASRTADSLDGLADAIWEFRTARANGQRQGQML